MQEHNYHTDIFLGVNLTNATCRYKFVSKLPVYTEHWFNGCLHNDLQDDEITHFAETWKKYKITETNGISYSSRWVTVQGSITSWAECSLMAPRLSASPRAEFEIKSLNLYEVYALLVRVCKTREAPCSRQFLSFAIYSKSFMGTLGAPQGYCTLSRVLEGCFTGTVHHHKYCSYLCRYQLDWLPSPRELRGFCTKMCAQPKGFCTTENTRGPVQ